ncbi:hypothetical protein JW968_04330 [Candidatus Woesearchaeota archaeon]|nr:hypothetical protein [Candidatus Woesearchaeota archaeon]
MVEQDRIEQSIISLLLIILISFYIYASFQGTEWVIDNIMLMGIALILYAVRKKYQINPYLMVMGSLGILLHGLGTFGWYSTEPFGIRYDHYTHFFGAFVFCLIVFNYLYETARGNGISRGRKLFEIALFSIMISLGFGSIIEITEYVGFRFFGPGEGILFYGTGDFGEWQNTILDIIFNLIGALFGSMIMILQKAMSCQEKEIRRTECNECPP